MDMPQLSRIDPRARVSAVSRSDEPHADVPREFAALLVGEEASRRRHHPPAFAYSADTQREPVAESIIESQSLAEADEILPEDAHDPQELRALLSHPIDGA